MSQPLRPPGDYGIDTLSKIYMDGQPLDALIQSLGLNQDSVFQQNAATQNRFWATPARYDSDPNMEVMEVRLPSARPINRLSFEVSRFPHRFYVQYYNTKLKAWKSFRTGVPEAVGFEGNVVLRNLRPAFFDIKDSIPAYFTPQPNLKEGEHPHHYGAGHWQYFDLRVAPVTTNRVRVLMKRTATNSPPRDQNRQAAAYSLGIRNFDLGYQVLNRLDVPNGRRHPTKITERETFSSTTDLLGSSVEFMVRENRAEDLLYGAIWKSEPQPISHAVVNLYVDARDSTGAAQVIDKFYLDPLTSGPHVNIYYSNDVIRPDRFAASDTPLSFPASRAGGGSPVTVDGEGMKFPSTFGFVDIGNKFLQWDPSLPFWLGMVVQPQFTPADSTDRWILDAGAVQVWIRSGRVYARIFDQVIQLDLDFTFNERLPLLLSYVGDRLRLRSGARETGATSVSPENDSVDIIRLGGSNPSDGSVPEAGNYRLRSLILKQETLSEEEDLSLLWDDPTSYVARPQFTVDDSGTSDNAVLRYDPSFQTSGEDSVNPYGLLGGAGTPYEDLEWIPINRDFKLRKGYYHFAPTSARFFKFEFTNLSPEPYSAFSPLTRRVQVFSSEIMRLAQRPQATTSNNKGGAGLVVGQDISSIARFADAERIDTGGRAQGPYTPTEALHALDPKAAERLRDVSHLYGFQPWQSNTWLPQFAYRQKHFYETVEVKQDTRLAFFVGLKAIRMYRANYVADDDSVQYLEHFHDDVHLDQAGAAASSNGQTWELRAGRITTATGLESDMAEMRSAIFHSYRKVRGVQFATQQTAPIQLLSDPDFNDRLMLNWQPYGDASIAPSDDYNTDIGSTIIVRRGNQQNFWSSIESRYPTWDDIELSDVDPYLPTWAALESDPQATPIGGVEGIDRVSPSKAGRVYAAARVFTPTPLSAPLYLQLVSESGAVLAEEETIATPGGVTEWFVGHTIGEGVLSESMQTWDQMEASHPTWNSAEGEGTWNDIDTTVTVYGGAVYPRLVQREATLDTWWVDNIAIYDDPIVWEFSNDSGKTWYPVYDIRNDPNGVFLFPDAASTDIDDGRSLVWRVRGYRPDLSVSSLAIRPWYSSTPTSEPSADTVKAGGPALSEADNYPAIEEDPQFRLWHRPIPEPWWFNYRKRMPLLRTDLVTIDTPDEIVEKEAEPLYFSSSLVYRT